MNVSPNQIAPAAQAGVKLLNLSSTLIPGDMKSQVIVLESILMGIATGNLVVVPNPENAVKLPLDTIKKEQDDDNPRLRKAIETEIETG